MSSERGVPGIGTIPLLSGLVLLSGASALIYQLLWLRLLGLVFGVTVHAASTVLASFMAGLAIGSYVTGRLAPRIRRPLLWFAAAEALIATTALLTPWALDALQVVYRALEPATCSSSDSGAMRPPAPPASIPTPTPRSSSCLGR